MLIEFKVSNYRSIAEEQVLSMVPATNQKEYLENILEKDGMTALNAAAFYGANASGKSNLFKAMALLERILSTSAKFSSTTKLPYDPFLLKAGFSEKPTRLEITFVLSAKRYRYGISFNRTHILEEWLFRKGAGREVNLFAREGEVIDVSSGFKGSGKSIDTAIEITKENTSFLSACDMVNVNEAKQIFLWLKQFTLVDGLQTEDEEIRTIALWKDPFYQKRIKEFFINLSLSVVDLEVVSRPFEDSSIATMDMAELRNMLMNDVSMEIHRVFAKHQVYDEHGNKVNEFTSWELEERESAGTNKAFQLSGPVLWTLENGGTLIVDEIEAKMHPLMTLHTINLFLNKETNPRGAQIIFATHDTNLLSYCHLRRDQIYFSEKNRWEATEIYSLSDFVYIGDNDNKGEKERPDTDKEKRYFEGRYGAIPMLNRLNFKYGKERETGTKSS